MTLKELGEFYAPYQQAVLTRADPKSKEANLRLQSQKRLREGFHSYYFGSIYGALFGCREIMTVHVREVADRDAFLQWKNGNRVEHLNLQLKELVSPNVNRKSGTAEAELQNMLNGLPDQYPNATDLTVAIYMNYGGAKLERVSKPENLNLGALWFFGWSKDQCRELFLIGGRRRNEHNFRLPWRRLGV
jgi:hypothetical protein